MTGNLQADDGATTMRAMENITAGHAVLTVGQLGMRPLSDLLRVFGLVCERVPDNFAVPGSFWGDSEAGLVGNHLMLRSDTPVHSALHEACHYLCMSADRRTGLHTDAGGDYDEENAVCFLQILLSDRLTGVGRERLMADMDAWGYSFRLGSARAWFEGDADEAQGWLLKHGLIDERGEPTGRLREG